MFYHISYFIYLLISRAFVLIVSLIVFIDLTTFYLVSAASNDLTTFYLIYHSYDQVYRSSLHPQTPKPSFRNLFYYRYYPNPLSNVVISNHIPSSLTIHLMQHQHLCYAYFILVPVLMLYNNIFPLA